MIPVNTADSCIQHHMLYVLAQAGGREVRKTVRREGRRGDCGAQKGGAEGEGGQGGDSGAGNGGGRTVGQDITAGTGYYGRDRVLSQGQGQQLRGWAARG